MIETIKVLDNPGPGPTRTWFRCPTCGWTSEWSAEGFGMVNECPGCRRGLNLVNGTNKEWEATKGRKGDLADNPCGICHGPDCEGCPKLPAGMDKGPGAWKET